MLKGGIQKLIGWVRIKSNATYVVYSLNSPLSTKGGWGVGGGSRLAQNSLLSPYLHKNSDFVGSENTQTIWASLTEEP